MMVTTQIKNNICLPYGKIKNLGSTHEIFQKKKHFHCFLVSLDNNFLKKRGREEKHREGEKRLEK